MSLPRDTMTMDNFKRSERGLPPLPERGTPKPDPELPVVHGQLKLEDIPNKPMRDIGVRPHNVQNEAGVRFMGYDLYLVFEDGEAVEGFLLEVDFEQLKRRIPEERSDLKKKASL